MRSNFLSLLAFALLAGFAFAQAPAKPLTQEELLHQIEGLSPASTDPGRGLPSRATKPIPGSPNASLFPQKKDAVPAATPKPEKKTKGPTEIVALDATFDQKAHIAVFIGQVVVTDPEFTTQSDKLTAYLKHDDKPAPGAAPKPATPAPTPSPDGEKPKKPPGKGGGLDHAIAEADPGKIVTVTQEKVEADGTTSRSVGHGKKATYDATSGDITLYGHPDVQQGINTCVSTEESTVMVLNRDGRMRVTGPHKTVIAEGGDLTK